MLARVIHNRFANNVKWSYYDSRFEVAVAEALAITGETFPPRTGVEIFEIFE